MTSAELEVMIVTTSQFSAPAITTSVEQLLLIGSLPAKLQLLLESIL
jgi:hypothetical protein